MSDALSARLAQEQARKVATEIAEPVARTTALEVATDVAGRTAQTIARDTAGLAVAELPGIAATVAERIAAERVVAEVNDWLLANPPAPGKAGLSVQGEQGPPGDDGRPGLVWRGPWSRGTQYQPNDAVSFEGSSYVATRPTRAKPPAGWDLLAEKGEPGETTGPAVLTSRGFGRGGYASGMIVDDEGVALNGGTVLGEIDFQGAGVSVAKVGGKAVATIPGGGAGSALTVLDEGVVLDAAVTSIDLTGAGVTATAVGHAITVTIPGGGGPVTTNVYVQPTDPGVVGDGKLWVDTTTPGPPWHVQIRNATDDGWEDLLAAYTATGTINVAAGAGGSQGATLTLQEGSGDAGGYFGGAGGTTPGSNVGAGFQVSGGNDDDNHGGDFQFIGGQGTIGAPGGTATFAAGAGDNGNDAGSQLKLNPGSGTGNPGKAQVTTNGSTGPGPLVSDGTDVTYSLAAFVEPTTATPEQIALSLIAAGLMAAS